MTLRAKTLVVIGTTLLLMIVFIISISKEILLGGYEKLEKENILQNADQAVRMIDDELLQIRSVVGDWAPWDESYQFMLDKNEEYIQNNLDDYTITNLPVDFLLYQSVDGSVAYCKYVDPESGEDALCPGSLLEYVTVHHSLFKSSDDGKGISGLIILPESPVFLASGPIVTSQFEGPVVGNLIAGRFLNEKEVRRLATKVNLSISLQRMDAKAITDDFKVSQQHRSADNPVTVVEQDEDTIAAFVVINDIQNKPILMMGIDRARLIVAQGKASLTYFIIAICVIGLVFTLAALIFLETTVLSRVVRLNAEVKDIGSTADLFKKTTIRGKDELADLSAEINLMIESVRVSSERDRAILASIADGYFELDILGNLVFFNDSLAKMLGYKKQDLIGMNCRQLLNISSAESSIAEFRQLYTTGQPITNMETGFTIASGKEIYLESTVSLIRDAQGRGVGFRGIARDVTKRRKADEELFHLAYHDALTGLPNRKAFYENLEKELIYACRYQQQRSLLFVDLDKFKMVNDTYGHDIGDHLLIEFAARVGRILRTTDNFYRLGGDEFVVILSEPQDHSPEVVAQRILDVMIDPFLIISEQIDFVTSSIGIAIFPLHGSDAESLLQHADKSMYYAKNKGNSFSLKAS
jgi:diguanylate cyclase (GGDEF)-like protein/PAS domain S-box-containing protein